MDVLARFIGGLSERVLAVLFVLAAAQFPLYYAAYSNTLAGAQAEAQTRYQELEREATQLKITVESFIVRHEFSADEAFQASGRIHRTTLEHYQRYSAMLTDLRAAVIWQKPWVLQRNFDRQLFDATQFEPGLPLTLEGLAYALIGLLLAWMLSSIAGLIVSGRRTTAY